MPDIGEDIHDIIFLLHGWSLRDEARPEHESYNERFGWLHLFDGMDLVSFLRRRYSGQDFGTDARAWLSYTIDNDENVRDYLKRTYGDQTKEIYLMQLDYPPPWAPEYGDL
ncbi:MAG: hypothetical protein AAFU54_14705 [Chloroflexota bacterium]